MNRRTRFFLFIRKRAWRFFFVSLALLATTLIVFSMLNLFRLKPSDGAAIFAGLLAFAIVWWQGYLIKEQMQLQALIELDKEWNSTEMLAKRHKAWGATGSVEKDSVEPVLEFLEKVSTLEKWNVVAAELIWDTFGWYVWRYYYYSFSAIQELREDWTNLTDPTLYCDLQSLWIKLLYLEVKERNKRRHSGRRELADIEAIQELEKTKPKFAGAEKKA